MNGRLRVGAAGLGLAFVLAIAFGATGVLTSKNERVALGASTTLTIITAPVLVRHAGGDFSAADDGSVLGPGDTVQTGDGGRAVLTYFEGSTVEIEPDSQLTIETAHANPDSSTVIVMQQDLGTTWHVVTHLLQVGSRYEVHTTAATASVRGTAFTVSVDPDGTTTETTTEGVVGNSDAAGTSTVLTPPGLQTTTRPGETPAPPQPAPEPERKVTVTVGDQNTLVVDSLGRANGIKDGKKILQTPGAQLAIVDGHLVITLPDLPDGQVTTHFLGSGGSTDVTTKVEEKGKSSANTPTAEQKTDDNGGSSPTVGEPLTPTEVAAAAAGIEHPGTNGNSAGNLDRTSTVSSPANSNESGNAAGTVAATSGTGAGSPTTGSVSNPIVNGPATTPGAQSPIAPTTISASSSNGTSTGASPVNGNGTGIAPVGPGAATSGTKPPIVPTPVGASNSNGTSTGTSPGTGNGKAPASSGVTSGTGSGSPSTGNAGNSTGNGGGSPAASGGGGAPKSGGSFAGNSGAILKDVLKDILKGKASK